MTSDFALFHEWFLNTYFYPPDMTISAHRERWEGFKAGLEVAKQKHLSSQVEND